MKSSSSIPSFFSDEIASSRLILKGKIKNEQVQMYLLSLIINVNKSENRGKVRDIQQTRRLNSEFSSFNDQL